MLRSSESARATSAAEARYRIGDPNSKPRSVKVIALDPPSERLVKRIAQGSWNGASFFTSGLDDAAPSGEIWSMQPRLSDLAGRTKDLVEEIATADLVVMISTAGGNPQVASVISEACALKHVMATGLIVDGSSKPEALSHTLARLRPHVGMLVVADGEEYVEAMLVALHA